MRKTLSRKKMRRKQQTRRRKQYGGAEYESLPANISNSGYLSLGDDRYYYDETCFHHKISKEAGNRRKAEVEGARESFAAERGARQEDIRRRKPGTIITRYEYNRLPVHEQNLWEVHTRNNERGGFGVNSGPLNYKPRTILSTEEATAAAAAKAANEARQAAAEDEARRRAGALPAGGAGAAPINRSKWPKGAKSQTEYTALSEEGKYEWYRTRTPPTYYVKYNSNEYTKNPSKYLQL